MRRVALWLATLGLVGCFRPGDGKGDEDKQDAAVAQGRDADPGSACGNGVIDLGEQCEATPLNLNGETCATTTVNVLTAGVLGCNADCTLNVSRCSGGRAGGGAGAFGGVGGSAAFGGVGGS
jgi:hypothetical protein